MTVTPKIELHLHIEGAVRPPSLLQIARRNGVTLPATSETELAELYRFTDLAHFVTVWQMTTICLQTRDDFRQILVDYAAEAAGFGAVYLEAIFSPCERVKRGVGWDTMFGGYTDGLVEAQERHGIVVRLTPEAHREADIPLAEECARQAAKYRDRGVVGFGLGGRERGFPAAPYLAAFRIARDGGLGLAPHAGEAAGPDSIRDGIRAVEDPALMAEIAEAGIVLDVCPTSNLRLGGVASIDEHPLPRLRAAGIECSISTDDPAMFNTDLGQEYTIAERLGVTAADAYRAGLAGALCDETTRTALAGLLPSGVSQ
jgi:aminodeoxyfutalosine deaminase